MIGKYIHAERLVALAALLASQSLLAVTADDVACYRCVEAPDIAGGAVNEWKIAPYAVNEWKIAPHSVGTTKIQDLAVTAGKIAPQAVGEWKLKTDAVTTPKIKNEAVTYDKLSPDLQQVMDAADTYDYRDYIFIGAGNVTQKVFALTGNNLGDCGGAGIPDTEVRDFVNTDLGGGVTESVQTYRRYTGGIGGTACSKEIVDVILDADGLKVVRYRWLPDGTTLLSDVTTPYDAVTNPLAGVKYFGSKMKVGIDFLSSGQTTKDGYDGRFLNKIVLTDVGMAMTIDPGGPNEETFSDCIQVHTLRVATHLSDVAQERILCAGVGIVDATNMKFSGSFNHSELIGYTVSP